jgi:hypothetical protein
MSNRLLTLAACITVQVFAASATAQRGIDFSGSRVLDETHVRPAPDIPQRLVVEQPVTTTNMLGAPMSPAYLRLFVRRFFGDVVQQDEYQIGVIGGTVGGLAGGRGGGGSRFAVTWRGDSLWIYRESQGASGENILSRGELWRLDDLGRLIISIETREKDEAATTQTLVYRRDER